MPAKTSDTKTVVLPRRWAIRLFVFLAGLLLLIWAAPMLAACSPLVSWACMYAQDYIDGNVQVGSISLGWFSPVVLYNVEVRDSANDPLVLVEKIETDRTLLQLLMNHDDLGSLRIEKPRVEWKFHGNDSNLERLLRRALGSQTSVNAPAPATASPLPHLHLEIIDGTLSFQDVESKLSWQAQALNISALLFHDADRTVQLNVQGVLHDGVEAGVVKAEVHLQNVTGDNPTATIKGRFSSFPLAVANVFVRRYQSDTLLTGSLQGHCHLVASLKDGKPLIDLSGEVTGNHVRMLTPSLAEPFYLERITAPCRLKLDNQWLAVERAEIESDLGKASMQGALDLGKSGLAALDQPGFDLAVDVNLSILAERLPRTLCLHEDLRLTSGHLNVKCQSESRANGIVWHGTLHTTDVRGLKGKYTIAWTEPIQLDFQARQLSKGVPLIDQLKCNARFLTMEASTSADQFTLTARADLQQLVEPLGEFIDLHSLKLGGKADAKLTVRQTPQDQFDLQGNAEFSQVHLSGLTMHSWQENQVSARFQARGQVQQTGQQRIESATLDIKLGGDLAQVQLIEPIPDVVAGPWGILDLRVEGDLTRWRERLRAATLALDDWELAGEAKMQMRVRSASQSIECTSASLQVNQIHVNGSSLRIKEPTLQMQTSARWDAKNQQLNLGMSKISCATVFLETDRLTLHPATLTLRGSVQVTGDIARLLQWTQQSGANPGDPMEGVLVGHVEIDTTAERLNADFNGSLKNFLYGTRQNPTWRESEMKCMGRCSYEFKKDTLWMERLNIISALMNANARGSITRVSTTSDLDLNGTLAYDLEKMEPQLRPLLGKDVKISGKDVRAFKLAGPLYPKSKAGGPSGAWAGSTTAAPILHFTDLQGEASLNWKALKALGCEVGPAEVRAVLQQGWFQLYPIETSLNGGKLRLQPNLRLEPEPLEMILLAGSVIDRARMTTEMCAGALGYVIPVLANVAEADGSISLTLEGGRIPLSQPKNGEVKGTFILHSARLGASPVITELSVLLKIPPPSSVVKECPVAFHMMNGKVYHQGLELIFPEFSLKSSGAVGLDGSLALVLEMPIPARLAAASKLTSSQAKQLIRIPVGGTMDRPRLDPRALESLTSTIGRSLFENQLNKLLQPR